MANKGTTRDYCLPVYFNREERAVLNEVSRTRGLGKSTLLKMLLRDEHRRLGLSRDGHAPGFTSARHADHH